MNKDELNKKVQALGEDIEEFLRKNDIFDDCAIYYNNKKITEEGIFEDKNPKDYFEYANPNTLSMSFEGELYDILNYNTYPGLNDKFDAIFEKHGFYYELGNAWNLAAYCEDCCEDCTICNENQKEEPIMISVSSGPEELIKIQQYWKEKSDNEPDEGSCVLGAGFKFNYKDKEYFMPSKSCNQGSLSWEKFVDEITQMLMNAECKNISYDWGRMD